MVVQAELARRGYYRGPINGVIGSGSRRAIREFQAAEGLPITGRIDESLIRALRTGELSAPPEDTSITPLPSPTPSAPEHDSPPVALWVKGKEGQQVLRGCLKSHDLVNRLSMRRIAIRSIKVSEVCTRCS